MFLLLRLFLISLCHYLIAAQYVLNVTPHTVGYQLDFPWQKKAKVIQSVDIEIKSPSDHKFTFKCTTYEDEDAKVDVVDLNGVLLDTFTVFPTVGDPCDSRIQNYTFIEDPVTGRAKIIYLWASKTPKCVKRTYEFFEYPTMMVVAKLDYPRVECPQTIKDYINQLPEGQRHGGIISLGPVGRHHVMDYNADVEKRGEPTVLEFPTKDPQGKSFKMICREDTLTVEDPGTRSNKIITGSIVHVDDESMVIEKFKLTSCSTDYINVNRQILRNESKVKIVYKTANGKCFERDYEDFGSDHMFYYSVMASLHFRPLRIKCPKSFVGDIHMNAYRSWYTRLQHKISPKKRPTPFAIEIDR